MTTEPNLVVCCPVCGQPKQKLAEKLYRVPICRQCSNEFTMLRCAAAVIDWVVLPPVLLLGVASAWLLLIAIVESTTNIVVIHTRSEAPEPTAVELALGASAWLIPVLTYLLFCAKDGCAGYSPGKIWLELRVVDQETGAPIGFVQSIKRNIAPAAMCFLTAIAAVQIRYGPRVGDEVGKTKVIWRRYAGRRPFLSFTKVWVGEPTTQLVAHALPVNDSNPYRAPAAGYNIRASNEGYALMSTTPPPSVPGQVLYCPVCGQPKRSMNSKLYGIPTCAKCIDGFAQRRSLAWIIDLLSMRFPLYAGLFCVLYLGETPTGFNDFWMAFGGILSLFGLVTYFLFFFKDGFSGYSLGKYCLGLRAFNHRSGKPANPLDSFARNFLPALMPIIALIIGVLLRKGTRPGDGFRDTKVIWLKYAKSPVFDVTPTKVKVTTDQLAASPFEIDPKDTNPYRAPQG